MLFQPLVMAEQLSCEGLFALKRIGAGVIFNHPALETRPPSTLLYNFLSPC